MIKTKFYYSMKELMHLILWVLIGAMIGCVMVGVLDRYYFGINSHNHEFTVQERTMFTLGLLWGFHDTTICKTKNYTVDVKIGDPENAYYGASYPLVSINGSPFIKSHAYGDFLLDRQEFVFYHDSKSSIEPTFTVRFDWFRRNESQQSKAQCYFEINKNNNGGNTYEYGTIIVKRSDKNRDVNINTLIY